MKLHISAVVFLTVLFGVAHAATQTVGGVSFDDAGAATDVLWAQGGVTAGLPANQREACSDPTDPASTVGPNGVNCRADEAAGYDLSTNVEIDGNGTSPDDILSFFFAQPVVNGAGNCAMGDYAGCDILIIDALNQSDQPTLSLTLNGVTILGVFLGDEGANATHYTVYGFDLADLGIAQGSAAANPLFLSRPTVGEGSPDIAAIIGVNFGTTVVPLPSAAPLLLSGLAGLIFAGRKRRKA